VKGYAVYFDQPVPYARAERIQDALVSARIAESIPDTVLFLEHTPVVTLGRRRREEHLLVAPGELQAAGIELYPSTRGGDVTYHAPGQLVLYPILRLGVQDHDAHGYLWNLEEIAIRTCADFGVPAERVPGKSGAWTVAGKIAAIGFHLKRWVTVHGMSFNVDLDLDGYRHIVPCGLHGDPVCSLQSLLGDEAPSVREVRRRMKDHFEAICGRRLDLCSPDQLPGSLARIWPEE